MLLKNQGNALPLDVNNFKSIAVIGAYADRATSGGGGSARIAPFNTVSPLGAIAEKIGNRAALRFLKFVPGTDLSKSDPATTGAGLLADAEQLAKECDLALVFARDFETEGADRAAITLPDEQDELISTVVRANPRTRDVPIVVYTGKDLSRDEEQRLKKHVESLIIKTGGQSHARLLQDTAVFLHRVDPQFPRVGRKCFQTAARAFQLVCLIAPAGEADQHAHQQHYDGDSYGTHRTQLRPPVAHEFRVRPESRHHITSWVESFM